jgi:bifunctional oligoribonuclease and PAP phosphatase NrnA
MQNLSEFQSLISTPKKIVITTHHKPDADALGSSLGLALFLEKLGHTVKVITPTDYPGFLFWMKGHDDVVIFNEGKESLSAEIIGLAEIIFCLDFNNLKRINELGEIVAASTAVKVLIDHHLEPEPFAHFQFWDTSAAATAEMVYQLIEMLGGLPLMDKDIAECLYAGLMTDTGSFKHPNTTKNVFLTAAALLEHGADTAKVARAIYDQNSVDRVKFFGYALGQKLVVHEQFNTAYFAISAEELKQFHSRTGDTEGLVNYALSIKGIVFAAVIIDRTEAIKISFRSVGDFSVNQFARHHFEGGGHKNAAGGISYLSLEDTVRKFEELLPQYKEQLNPILNVNI